MSRRLPGALILGSDFKALGVVRSLGRRGIPSIVVDDLPRSAWLSRYVVKRFKWPSEMGGPAFLDFLTTLAPAQGLEGWVLMPLQDEVVEFVARNTEPLSGTYRLVTPPWGTLRWAHDKRLAYRVAGALGIATPRTWYPASEEELASMPISFPAIIKPAVSIRMQYAMGRKALEAHDRDSLLRQYRAAGAIIGRDPLMVQEVIPGDGRTQYSVGAFCDQGSLVTAMTARRTRQFPYDYGVSSTFVEALEIPRLLEVSARLLGRLRLSGMVEVEFMHDPRDQRDKLLDINVRPWGWHTLAIACGLDFPYMQYRQALGQPVDGALPRYGYRWRRLITDLPAGLQEIRHGRSSLAAYLRSLLRPAVPSVFDWRDPLPAIGDVIVSLRSRLRRKFRARVHARATSPLMGERQMGSPDPSVRT